MPLPISAMAATGGRRTCAGSAGSSPCSTSSISARSARRAGDRSEMVEAGAERKGAGARQPAEGRLQPEQAAEGGRHADRAVGVGAERGGDHAGRDRGARAAGRAARHAAGVVRVERGAVVDVLAGEVIGVFAHVQAAEQHRAGRPHLRHQRRVGGGRRIVAVDQRAGAGDDALDVEEVLDRIGHAGERQRLARGDGRVDRVGLGERARSKVRSVKAPRRGFVAAIAVDRGLGDRRAPRPRRHSPPRRSHAPAGGGCRRSRLEDRRRLDVVVEREGQ